MSGRPIRITLKRVYEEPAPADGLRVLVERLWPRGLSKEKVKIHLWLKDAAPSTELRKWFRHDPDKWGEFKQRYFAELAANEDTLLPITKRTASGPITFVYSSREERFNNAVALKEFIESR